MNAGVGDGDADERQSGDIAVYCGDTVGGWKRVGKEEKAKDSKKKKEPRSKMCTWNSYEK